MRYLWESTQKARRSHHCDSCHERIEPGDTYRREVQRFNGKLMVFAYHESPSCPEFDYEFEPTPVRVESAVVVMLEVKSIAVVKVQLNGELVTEYETQVVSTTVSEPPQDEPDDDVDIEF